MKNGSPIDQERSSIGFTLKSTAVGIFDFGTHLRTAHAMTARLKTPNTAPAE
jgi:hypothetical protein